jgi:ABC-type phosphate transport system substrate-binding protein
MNPRFARKEHPVKSLLLTLFAAVALSASIAHAQVIVIANPSTKASEVSKSDLRDVFSGSASSFKDAGHVTPVLLKAGTSNDEFLSAYVGKTDSAFRASWRSLVFSGQATMPKSLDTDAAVVEYVAHTPGAIGYISKSSPHDGVKVLTVH